MFSNMEITYKYVIADLKISISFVKGQTNGSYLLPSFEPFRITEDEYNRNDNTFFCLHVDDNLRSIPKEKRERIKDVDTGNGITIVDQNDDGGYQFIIKNIFGASCCLLQTDKEFTTCHCALNGTETMRMFGLNNAIMLIFAFAGCKRDVLLIHASLVRQNGWGYAFTAKSGTGKSTQVSMWLRYIQGCDLMNDDNPIIRIIDGIPYIYGGPWSGKTPCYRNVRARLGAVVAINRDTTNHVEPLTTIGAFAMLLSACSTMKWDNDIVDNICNIIKKIIETTPNYNLFCRPDKEAAIICQKTISRSEKLR
jgi:hypothetical protein